MSSLALRRAITISSAICALMIVTTPTFAAGPPTNPAATSNRITAYLATHPGGKPLSDNEIGYGDGAFIVTLTPPPRPLAAPDCPAGWFCFYDRPSYGYPRGRLSDCGLQNLATWGWQDLTESAYYNMSSGRVVFLNNSQPLFEISTRQRGRADAYPYRNLADHVRRYC